VSLTDVAGSGGAREAASVKGMVEDCVAAGVGDCCEKSGTTASRTMPSTRIGLSLHFHPTHLIYMSAPLALDSTARDPSLCRTALYAPPPRLIVCNFHIHHSVFPYVAL